MISAGHTHLIINTLLGQLMAAPTAEAAALAMATTDCTAEASATFTTVGVHLTEVNATVGVAYDEQLLELERSRSNPHNNAKTAQHTLANLVRGMNGHWGQVQLATARSEGALLGAAVKILLLTPHLSPTIRQNIRDSLNPFPFYLSPILQQSFLEGFYGVLFHFVQENALPDALDLPLEADEFDMWLFGAQAFAYALLDASTAAEHHRVIEHSAPDTPFMRGIATPPITSVTPVDLKLDESIEA